MRIPGIRSRPIPRRPVITEPIARAASLDAGSRSMRRAGRTRWNLDDYEAARKEYDRLWPDPEHNPGYRVVLDEKINGVVVLRSLVLQGPRRAIVGVWLQRDGSLRAVNAHGEEPPRAQRDAALQAARAYLMVDQSPAP